MRFKRNTHDENGNPRPGLPGLHDYAWPTCNIHMLGLRPKTLQEIHEAHLEYDRQWEPGCFDYTLPDIMEGLAHLIRLGVVVAVDSDD